MDGGSAPWGQFWEGSSCWPRDTGRPLTPAAADVSACPSCLLPGAMQAAGPASSSVLGADPGSGRKRCLAGGAFRRLSRHLYQPSHSLTLPPSQARKRGRCLSRWKRGPASQGERGSLTPQGEYLSPDFFLGQEGFGAASLHGYVPGLWCSEANSSARAAVHVHQP